jgi:hypothetical protein
MFVGKLRTTVRERILLHLASFSVNAEDHEVPFEVTQEGIASAVGIKTRHLIQNIRPMIADNLVIQKSTYHRGGRQRSKVYFLTGKGVVEAGWLDRHSTRVSTNASINE